MPDARMGTHPEGLLAFSLQRLNIKISMGLALLEVRHLDGDVGELDVGEFCHVGARLAAVLEVDSIESQQTFIRTSKDIFGTGLLYCTLQKVRQIYF